MYSIVTLFCLCVRYSSGDNFSSALLARDGGSGWGWSSSGNGLQSFFDIALTALAFLSFGIFLLNLLLNALMFTGVTTGLTATGPIITNTATAPTGGGGAGGGGAAGQLLSGGTGISGRSRLRRSPLELHMDSVSAVDSLANSVLSSIEAMVQKHECVPKLFCQGNRQAKVVGRGFQYIMPVYSFGASFIGEKFGLHEKLPDHIDAILLGVDETNCQTHFPQC